MPGNRTVGMDHQHFSWNPLPKRDLLHWPHQAPVAVSPVISLEYFEDPLPEGSVIPKDLAGGLGLRPEPNYPMLAHREYGHRVGIFRIANALRELGVPLTVAIDAMTAEAYPFLVEYLLERGATFLAHGISVTRSISSVMSIDEETSYIEDTKRRLTAAGVSARGWLGPEYGESERTPQLLAAAGYDYLCDWLNDEQPYRLNYGGMIALPMWCDYDDAYALSKRIMTLDGYERLLCRGFDQLNIEGAQTARVMAFQVRPWLTGQPHRIHVLENFLRHAAESGRPWFANTDQIIDAYASALGPDQLSHGVR